MGAPKFLCAGSLGHVLARWTGLERLLVREVVRCTGHRNCSIEFADLESACDEPCTCFEACGSESIVSAQLVRGDIAILSDTPSRDHAGSRADMLGTGRAMLLGFEGSERCD
mgnify:CR=1 FL=1